MTRTSRVGGFFLASRPFCCWVWPDYCRQLGSKGVASPHDYQKKVQKSTHVYGLRVAVVVKKLKRFISLFFFESNNTMDPYSSEACFFSGARSCWVFVNCTFFVCECTVCPSQNSTRIYYYCTSSSLPCNLSSIWTGKMCFFLQRDLSQDLSSDVCLRVFNIWLRELFTTTNYCFFSSVPLYNSHVVNSTADERALDNKAFIQKLPLIRWHKFLAARQHKSFKSFSAYLQCIQFKKIFLPILLILLISTVYFNQTKKTSF